MSSEPADATESLTGDWWNGLIKPGRHGPHAGRAHKARIEDGRIVAVSCGHRPSSWVPVQRNSPNENLRICERCAPYEQVEGVGSVAYRIRLSEAYEFPVAFGNGGVV